jgi:hypothetical protein
MAAIGAAMLLSGCASPGRLIETWVFAPEVARPTSPVAVQAPKPGPRVPVAHREVTFPLEVQAPDAKRPETVAQFALKLAERGDDGKAAGFLVEAADGPGADSEGNAFRIACLSAAAALYLRSGELKPFQEVAARLHKELDRYQAAAAPPTVAVLLAIAATLDGKRTDVTHIPPGVRALFREAGR